MKITYSNFRERKVVKPSVVTALDTVTAKLDVTTKRFFRSPVTETRAIVRMCGLWHDVKTGYPLVHQYHIEALIVSRDATKALESMEE